MKKMILIGIGSLAAFVSNAQETLQTITDRGNVTTNSMGIGSGYTGAMLNVNAIGADFNNSTDVTAMLANYRYNSTNSAGENKLVFAWANHYGAGISAYKETVNTTGFKFYTEYGFNIPSEKMRITATGNVGIGTTNPSSALDVAGLIQISGVNSVIPPPGLSYGLFGYAGVGLGVYSGATGPNQGIGFWTNLNNVKAEAVRINNNGDVGIGTSDTKGYKLAIAGNMIAESVKVKLQNTWPDFVFAKSYEPGTLQETERHIKEKGHLPGIPSAAEVKANGIDLGEMNAKLLQKIEELTLHLIEQNKQLIKQNERLTKQDAKLQKLEFSQRR